MKNSYSVGMIEKESLQFTFSHDNLAASNKAPFQVILVALKKNYVCKKKNKKRSTLAISTFVKKLIQENRNKTLIIVAKHGWQRRQSLSPLE